MSSSTVRRLSQIAIHTSPSPQVIAQTAAADSGGIRSKLTGDLSSVPSSKSSTMASRGRLHEPILLVCDIQEKFARAIYEFDRIVATTSKLLGASDALGFPVASSTQSAAKLGDTVASLQLSGRKHFKHNHDKTLFSMYNRGDDTLMALLKAADGKPRDVLLVGIETHICITQTALDLLAAGHRVYVISDGVSSCNREEKPIALARLANEGCKVTTSESIIYEIMGDASIPEFRDIAKLVKETKESTTESLKALHW